MVKRHGDRRKRSIIYFIGVPEVENRENGEEVITKVIMVDNFQNWLKI